MDGLIDGRKDRQMNRWMDKKTDRKVLPCMKGCDESAKGLLPTNAIINGK